MRPGLAEIWKNSGGKSLFRRKTEQGGTAAVEALPVGATSPVVVAMSRRRRRETIREGGRRSSVREREICLCERRWGLGGFGWWDWRWRFRWVWCLKLLGLGDDG
jgi:hypothetical protein